MSTTIVMIGGHAFWTQIYPILCAGLVSVDTQEVYDIEVPREREITQCVYEFEPATYSEPYVDNSYHWKALTNCTKGPIKGHRPRRGHAKAFSIRKINP